MTYHKPGKDPKNEIYILCEYVENDPLLSQLLKYGKFEEEVARFYLD
jgi:serine/threonine protein kinase